MRHTMLVLALAALMAMMMALAGPSLAKTTKQDQTTYRDKIAGYEYVADPTNGIGKFRATVTEGDLIPGGVDATVHYTGTPGPEVTSNIEDDSTWIMCSEFTADPDPSGATKPECKPDSKISLTGTWRSGTVKWDKDGTYVIGPLGRVWIGKAEVKGVLTVKGGTVNGKTVSRGSGEFEGTLDHTPILNRSCPPEDTLNLCKRPTVTGTMELNF